MAASYFAEHASGGICFSFTSNDARCLASSSLCFAFGQQGFASESLQFLPCLGDISPGRRLRHLPYSVNGA